MTLLTVIEQTLYGGGNKQSLFPGIACFPYVLITATAICQ